MPSSAEISELDAKAVLGPQRAEIEALWRLVFPETTDERFAEILPRHAGRRGFRFLAAQADDALVAFAYGYLGGPGEWWHDRVAADLGPERAHRWLPPGHFEFGELQVHPSFRRTGLGARLHDALLEGLESPTAVLSTQRDNEPAISLYRGRGWEVILPEIDFGTGKPFLVMGRDLPSPAP
jgi:ribosomal protein S18 acetylase RimI-like enzyme